MNHLVMLYLGDGVMPSEKAIVEWLRHWASEPLDKTKSYSNSNRAYVAWLERVPPESEAAQLLRERIEVLTVFTVACRLEK